MSSRIHLSQEAPDLGSGRRRLLRRPLRGGGIAHSFHILVGKLTKNDAQPKVVWRAVGATLKDYTAFLDALRTGKLHDSLDYAH